MTWPRLPTAGNLRYLDKQPVDVVLTDLHMPGFDGLDLIAQAGQVRTRRPDIIAMTGQPKIRRDGRKSEVAEFARRGPGHHEAVHQGSAGEPHQRACGGPLAVRYMPVAETSSAINLGRPLQQFPRYLHRVVLLFPLSRPTGARRSVRCAVRLEPRRIRITLR